MSTLEFSINSKQIFCYFKIIFVFQEITDFCSYYYTQVKVFLALNRISGLGFALLVTCDCTPKTIAFAPCDEKYYCSTINI